MSDEHRVKIQNSNVLNALIEHAEGKREMSATQVTAATTLLRKVLPDLQAVQISGDAENPLQVKHSGSTKLLGYIEAIASRVNAERS